MKKAKRRNSGRVRRSEAANTPGEDPDFEERFRRRHFARLVRGVRNGLDLLPLLLFRMGFSETLRFCGHPIEQSDNQATYRLIVDIMMRGEYDFPGMTPEPGWKVVDVGANVGIYALLAARRGARVVSYEPSPVAFARLVANCSAFPVTCHQAAVTGSPRGSVELYHHPLRDTRNTLLGEIGGVANSATVGDGAAGIEHAVRTTVPAVAIADVLAEPCDLLKIACEGAEIEIITHAGAALWNAARIVVELHPNLTTPHGDTSDVLDVIGKAGFDVELTEPLTGTSRQFLLAQRKQVGRD